MKITAIRCDADNYSYWIERLGGSVGLLVDAGSAPEIKAFFKENGIAGPGHIFSTHKHFDHCGGNAALKIEGTKIYAGDKEAPSVPGCNTPMEDGESIVIDGITITAIHVPCHTKGHVLYLVKVNDLQNEKIESVIEHKTSEDHWVEYSKGINRALFTGDTVFVGGCGRFFEGTADQMLEIMDKINTMAEDLYVFCGHEYSFDDAKFGIMVEPKNPAMIDFVTKAKEAKEKGGFLIPSTLKDERNYNVFMRCRTKEIQEVVKSSDPIVCMNKLRQSKNNGSFP